MQNLDEPTVRSFGEEWSAYDQSGLSEDETSRIFEAYFSIFPWSSLPKAAVGADIGCGSGRWARRVAPRVGALHCVDASNVALQVARRNLAEQTNCHFHHASVGSLPLASASLDFCYSLGVLHHTPDTQAALSACVSTLKPGAPFLLYLYYALDNRPLWFRLLWRSTDLLRRGIARLPFWPKRFITQLIAILVYWPLARMSWVIERGGGNPAALPLNFYRDKSFYTMRTDALDRFGTRLEKRFTKLQVERIMQEAGLSDIQFSSKPPYWCAVGHRIKVSTRG